jgi:murein DD-endopeptidase MepM/ murein hydrolase activator NlpD
MGAMIDNLYKYAVDPSKMSSDTIKTINKYAQMTGLDAGAIMDGLKVAYTQQGLDTQIKQAQLAQAGRPDLQVIGQRMVSDGMGGLVQQNVYGYYDPATKSFKEMTGFGIGQVPTPTGAQQPTTTGEFDFNNFLSSIKGGTITQDFNTPTNYIAGRTTHGGYDIAGTANQPIQVPISGTVVEITKDTGKGTGWGNSVVIQDAQGNQWRMGHFNNVTVNKGEKVNSGQVAGYLGNTGKVMGEGGGYHLHIEAKDKNGQLFDIRGGQMETTPRLSAITQQAKDDPAYFSSLNAKQKAMVNNELAGSGLSRKYLTDSDLEAYGNEYEATGIIPKNLPEGSFSQVAEFARNIPKQEGKVYNITTGTAPKNIAAAQLDDIVRLSFITKQVEKLKELEKKRAGGLLVGPLEKAFGNVDQNAYLGVRKSIVDEIGRMQSGAVLNEQEVAYYEDYLPGLFSEPLGIFGMESGKKIGLFADFMQERLQTALQSQGLDTVGRKMNINVGGKQITATRVFKNGQWGWDY